MFPSSAFGTVSLTGYSIDVLEFIVKEFIVRRCFYRLRAMVFECFMCSTTVNRWPTNQQLSYRTTLNHFFHPYFRTILPPPPILPRGLKDSFRSICPLLGQIPLRTKPSVRPST